MTDELRDELLIFMAKLLVKLAQIERAPHDNDTSSALYDAETALRVRLADATPTSFAISTPTSGSS